MDQEKIGKFIEKLRKSSKMTQEQLAQKLHTSRENISRWENGKNLPSIETLVRLSKLFDVSVNEIIVGENRNNENMKKIDNISVDIIKESNKKIKKIMLKFVFGMVFMILIFLCYYFINTYNTIYVYTLAAENDNFSSLDGIAIFSKNKCYLRIGDIQSKNGSEYDKYELFYYDNNTEHLLFYSDDAEINLNNYSNYSESFSYENRKKIINNLYLKIIYSDGLEDIIKVETREDMTNNLLLFKSKSNNIVYPVSMNENNKGNDEDNLNYIYKNFDYDKTNDTYTYNKQYEDFLLNMQYSNLTNFFTVIENKKSIQVIMDFNLITGDLNYTEMDNEGTILNTFIYNIKTHKCEDNSCDENHIKYFMTYYYNIYLN